MDIDGLKQINQHIVKTAVDNKAFKNGTIDGYMVAAIDGTKFFGSNKKSCSECLKNTKGKTTHCFHSGAVMSTVGIGNAPNNAVPRRLYEWCVEGLGCLG
ncbi:MAG: hypothetical protein P4L49_13380 [Desulfosporosinus sp.]|nr:hypothetical protein [Desulfosporosinus sp.]